MAIKKEYTIRGKTVDELKALSMSELAEVLTSKQRRKLKRGFTEAEKAFLKKVERKRDNIETHCRDMIILPMMVGKTIKIHNGKTFSPIMIMPEMIGHCLGEFALTRSKVAHNAPGIGATKSSGAISVR